jgi:hypothetical protein
MESDGKGQGVAAEIRTLAASELMRNRVLDVRLFYQGGGHLEDSLSGLQGGCHTLRNFAK